MLSHRVDHSACAAIARRPRRSTRWVAVATLVVVTCLASAAAPSGARPAAAQAPNASFLVPGRWLGDVVPSDLSQYPRTLLPAASAAVRERQGTLAQTVALAMVVHRALRTTGANCFGYATVMVDLGRQLGLPVRLTVASAGFNAYDTHTTVSVWLSTYHRWGIVDPTFGGTFTRIGSSRPLDGSDLQDAVTHGWIGQVLWHSAGADSSRPSNYYVDIVSLFRYVAVWGDVDQRLTTLALPDSALLGGHVISSQAMSAMPPSAQVPVSVAGKSGRDAVPTSLVLPPAYAPVELLRSHVTLPARIAVPARAIVVWTGAKSVKVDSYDTAPVDGGSLSPIFGSSGSVELSGQGVADVRVFAARKFPASNER